MVPPRFHPAAALVAVALALAACDSGPDVARHEDLSAEETAAPASVEEKVSYSVGSSLGRNLQRDGIDIVKEQLISGVIDGLTEGDLKLTEEEMQQVMQEFQQKMQEKVQEKAAAAGVKNIEEGKAFLEANSKNEGVVTTASGLQYQILTEGDGAKPKLSDTISAHYHGTLIDGTVFDSSVARGQPASFGVGRVIAGWTEALQLMPVGSKWRLFIPSDLAYQERGAPGGTIGPNAALIFDVELLGIQ